MILIGQYDSSFVRRVGIALTLYGMRFEHRPWSVFGDVEKIRPYSPLVRVPVLVLDDGDVLVESHAVLDYLDSLVPPERALYPRAEPARHKALKVAALATGLADNAVSLFYEMRLHGQVSETLVERRRGQILGALAALEADRAKRPSRLLVRGAHRPCRHRGGLRAAPCRRGASRADFARRLSGARRPLRASSKRCRCSSRSASRSSRRLERRSAMVGHRRPPAAAPALPPPEAAAAMIASTFPSNHNEGQSCPFAPLSPAA